MMHKFGKNGFTLIELLIVVAILAILALIAYPSYTNMVQKARRTDARAALSMIASAQEQFYTVNGTYADDLTALSIPGVQQINNITFSEEGHYILTINLDDGFTAIATATATQASDDCNSFTLNSLGVRTATTDNCW
ncbi:MAG: prepilin-type N-terminal cleavage/methylation domain-containing protein [Gammaproteobacteria bacterium]|nr:prepilin-type N-terminal cleavage/methylation domain-containing protein [Gammaproteobacteria bacterium]